MLINCRSATFSRVTFEFIFVFVWRKFLGFGLVSKSTRLMSGFDDGNQIKIRFKELIRRWYLKTVRLWFLKVFIKDKLLQSL